MTDLRIFSYLPNPRLYKATITARYTGCEIEIVGAKPRELPGWLWDYEAHALPDDDRSAYAAFAREAKTGFSGTLYKTDAFLAANPFGDVPTAFGADGTIGIFESNSIMRAAARSGPNAGCLYGGDAMTLSRIDGFLDRSLVFARDLQRYLLGARSEGFPLIHDEMARGFGAYLGGIEQALGASDHVAGETLSLADVVLACEIALFSNELHMQSALEAASLDPILPSLRDYSRVHAHLERLAAEPHFAADLAPYFEKLGLAVTPPG